MKKSVACMFRTIACLLCIISQGGLDNWKLGVEIYIAMVLIVLAERLSDLKE